MKKKVFLICMLFYSIALFSSNDLGIKWLEQKVQSSNLDSEIANVNQASTETYITLKNANSTIDKTSLLDNVNVDINTTEMLSRKIALENSTLIKQQVLSKLTSYQNQNGGFGELEGYDSTVIDTAFALQAYGKMQFYGENVEASISYLLTMQNSDGSWSDGRNNSSIYVTANVLNALAYYQTNYSIETNIKKAQTFLLSQQKSNGAIGEIFETALSTNSLLMTFMDPKSCEPSLDYLRITQSTNGSWDNDIYTTALSLNTLFKAQQPISNPSLASLIGNVVDGDSMQPLSGIAVILGDMSTLTDSKGEFAFTDVNPSIYNLKFSKEGYSPLSTSLTLSAGQVLNLGTVSLLTQSSKTTGTIRGVITSTTGKALAGVQIIAANKATVTDQTGSYQLTDLEPGEFNITVSLDGYYIASSQSSLTAGSTVLYSPSLKAINSGIASPASVHGKIVDKTTSTPITGATITFSGAKTYVLKSNNDGIFENTNIDVGTYNVLIEKVGYMSIQSVVSLHSNTISEFGTLTMQQPDPTITTASIEGIVTDTAGIGLSNVNVSVKDQNTTTDSQGNYHIEGIEAGAISISINADNYYPAVASVDALAGQNIVFSPQLMLIPEASMSGVILDANSSLPIKDALITLNGSSTESVLTDIDGKYEIKPLNIGELTISATKDGYDSVSAISNIKSGTKLVFSPKLYPQNTSPVNANSSSISGVVMDSSSNALLNSVQIKIVGLQTTKLTSTDETGKFEFNGIKDNNVTISFTYDGYKEISYLMPLEPLESLELGQVRMRKLEVQQLLPDLAINSLEKKYETNATSLDVNGFIDVNLTNTGTTAVNTEFSIVAFYDANDNNEYDQSDITLGEVTTSNIVVDENRSMEISLHGTLPYRDAPVSVYLDSQENIIELDEENNFEKVSTSYKAKPIKTGSFNPIIKFEWKQSNVSSSSNQVMAMPLVVPLEDTNNDGNITTMDSSSIVFSTFEKPHSYDKAGVIRAISGKDGHELWSINAQTSASVSMAAADIDHDGFIDIVSADLYGGLIVLNYDGTIKWKNNYVFNGASNGFFGVISIADLDADGNPEIIIGKTVFNADGSLKWKGSGVYVGETRHYTGYKAQNSTIADLDGDGFSEVIAGPSVYSHDGNLKWMTQIGDGFTAIGNFNNDKTPEIVVVSQGKVYLLNNKGKVIWGPVTIPGGGYTGAPTIADFDGDGEVEIGIAGAYYYVVFETDGSVKWKSKTEDDGSSVTGSSVFDFNGDGKVEVVYADEHYFRIYDGKTGNVTFSIKNSSGTLYELPVVADIDSDGHAEIIIAANDYAWGSQHGIRVFEDANDSWMPTRSIWNQHSYHITNINDDGTIPAHEKPSWLTHNTYRLNTFLDRDPLAVADYTVSLLRLIDNGASNPYTLKARIGNGGLVSAPQPVTVSFFDGDPSLGGLLIGNVNVNNLSADSYTNIELPNITGINSSEIVAIIDYDNVVKEYDETNNQMSIPTIAYNTLGTLSVSTDAPKYADDDRIQLQATLTNTSAMEAQLSVELIVHDINGKVVSIYDAATFGMLESNESTDRFEIFDANDILAGNYTFEGILRDTKGNILDVASTPFTIVAGDGSLSSKVALRTQTDKQLYHTTDSIEIDNLVKNLTTNYVLPESILRTTVTNSNSQIVYNITQHLKELGSQGTKNSIDIYAYSGLAEGNYSVQGTLMIDGEIWAQDSTTIQITENVKYSLKGTVAVDTTNIEAGIPVVCSADIYNRGVSGIKDQQIRQLFISFNDESILEQRVDNIYLDANATIENNLTLQTNGLTTGIYTCALQVSNDGNWDVLDYTTFNVTKPPIEMDYNLTIGSKGRLLVLLDEAKNKKGHKGKCSSNDVVDYSEPYGPKEALGLDKQRTYLENLLKNNNYAYTIVENEQDFESEFRSGNYNAYVLLQERIKLSKQLQDELSEAVYRGEGLLIAGIHDQRNSKVEDALGIKINSNTTKEQELQMIEQTPYESLNLTLPLKDKKFTVRLKEANLLGSFSNKNGCKEKDNSGAVTSNIYYKGKFIFVGFDLLVYASMQEDNMYEKLLNILLQELQPDEFTVQTNDVLPLRLELVNKGISTQGNTYTQSLNTNANIVDSGDAYLDANNNLVWNFMLEENNSTALNFWMKLPSYATYVELQTDIYTGDANSSTFYESFTNGFDVVDSKTLDDVIVDVESLKVCDMHLIKHILQKAKQYEEKEMYDKELKTLLLASKQLSKSSDEASKQLRYEIALIIKRISKEVK